jgi:hypothetical protein
MPFTLYEAVVPSWLQLLNAAHGWLDKAAASGIVEEELLSARLIEDMLPFAYQVKAMTVHSRGAIEGVRAGVFRPRFGEPNPTSLAELRGLVDGAIAFLSGLTEADLESLAGQDMRFEVGEKRLPFTVPDFLLSFSQPNFYFHSSTAYGILRMKGVKVGKLDYLGRLRLRKG